MHIFNTFLSENKSNKHNNINGISSFRNGLNNLFSSTGFYFKSEVIEGSHKGENIFFSIFGHFSSKNTFSRLWYFFFLPSGCPINSIFRWQYIFIRFMFLMNYFSLNYQNAYGHQTFQGGDMLRVALTHKYTWHLNGVVLWGHVTNEIHISTCRRCINNTLGNMMT